MKEPSLQISPSKGLFFQSRQQLALTTQIPNTTIQFNTMKMELVSAASILLGASSPTLVPPNKNPHPLNFNCFVTNLLRAPQIPPISTSAAVAQEQESLLR